MKRTTNQNGRIREVKNQLSIAADSKENRLPDGWSILQDSRKESPTDRWGGAQERICRKTLHAERFTPDLEDPRTRHTVACFENCHFYDRADSAHYDLLCAEGVTAFLREACEPLVGNAGGNGKGLFLADPMLFAGGQIPWSAALPETYRNLFGESLTERLPDLFMRGGDPETARRYAQAVAALLKQTCFSPLAAWCAARGLSFRHFSSMASTANGVDRDGMIRKGK